MIQRMIYRITHSFVRYHSMFVLYFFELWFSHLNWICLMIHFQFHFTSLWFNRLNHTHALTQIEISVNGLKIDHLQMKLGDAGEAFFVVKTTHVSLFCLSFVIHSRLNIQKNTLLHQFHKFNSRVEKLNHSILIHSLMHQMITVKLRNRRFMLILKV